MLKTNARRRAASLTLATLTAGLLVAAPSSVLARTPTAADRAFDALAKRYISSIAELHPSVGTTLGDHRFDDKLPDVSAAGRARDDAQARSLLAALAKIDRKRLDRDRQVDAALLENDLRETLWSDEALQSWAWDVQIYNEAAAGALYGLAARDFAPWPQRLKAATARMEAMPAMLAEARRQIVPARVPKVFAQTVSQRNAGITDIVSSMLAPHEDSLDAADRARFDQAFGRLKTAVAENQTWLDTVLIPQAEGDFRLGPKLYDEKIRFALMSSLTRVELKTRAEAAVIDPRRQMYATAKTVLSGTPSAPPLPEAPTADQQQAAIEAALALTYARPAPRDGLIATAKTDLVAATDFVRARGLVAMPDAPVKVITMPKFQQGSAVANDDPPGPLEKGLDNFFAISPVPESWTEAQATSFLSEYNAYMIQDLVVHEAMPGHYLQLFHANQNRSTLRAVLASGPFVEGWAVYAEGMMADEGYQGGDPLLRLTVLKMRLRSITNTLLDIGIQTEGMTREQGMTLMMRTAFQQEREAAGKWLRASLSSTQLLSYFTGYAEHMALREEARTRWGPAFTLRRYNDAVLAHGSPPTRFVRELMFDLPIQ